MNFNVYTKRCIKILATCFFVALVSFDLMSQSESEDKLGSWYIYNGFFNVGPKTELFFETQLRTWEIFKNPETFFLRPYFNYNLIDNFQTGLGLEYHKSWSYAELKDDRDQSNEFRITIQGMLFQKVGKVSVQHRYRYEFRNIDSNARQRTRYSAQLTIPLGQTTIKAGTVFINTFGELMIDTKPDLQLSQLRLYLAGGYHFTKSLSFQLGYLNVYRTNSTHHRLQFFLTQKFWFYEKEN